MASSPARSSGRLRKMVAVQGMLAPVEGAAVLLVDDEPLLLSLMARELEDAGHLVHTAGGGPEALELLDRLPIAPVVLVTDLRMEPMDGAELARNVQAKHPEMRCLFVSGFGLPDRYGPLPGPLLAKPFTSEQFLRAVRDVLRAGHGAQ